MQQFNYPTPEPLACVRVIAAAGGRMGHSDKALEPFCDDASTLTKPDVFNECHDAGWLISSHDDRMDESFVMLTDEGRSLLANQA
jgi:hypothetical protein